VLLFLTFIKENLVMAGTYKCPRCDGTDIYFAQRQRITGVGGIYGNKAQMVKTALCKVCGENADFTPDVADVLRLKKVLAIVIAGVVLFIVIAVWANSTLVV
jgi:hypothetical protein